MTPELRKELEWAYNWLTAISLIEDETIKGIARAISDGIVRGEDATDDQLVESFVDGFTDADTGDIESEWTPDDPRVRDELVQLVQQYRLKEGEHNHESHHQ